MLEIKNVNLNVGNTALLSNINLTLEQGKIYGVLGPNGAGKSTTMNMITGYLGATSGEIKINGHDILKEPEEAKKCIGYLPELPPLYMDMTVKEYLDFVADLKQLEKSLRKRYVEEAMETTGTTEVAGRMIRNLSKGYRQRVGFAQAILGYPEIIILDVPTVGLDPKQIIEIRELIRHLGEKHTVILSSHILPEISAVCDHQIAFSDIFILMYDKVPQTDTRIKIQVAHRQRLLKDIPKSLLRVLQEKIGIEGEFTFRKTLGDAQLEFNVGVSRRRLVADRDTANKIIVLE